MTTGMSAREYLASIGKESALKSAPAGHRLDPLRADILALRNAGYTYRGIYEWLLEHKPMYADHVKATKSVATDITAIGNYVLRVERGEIGRKPGRPRKNQGATRTTPPAVVATTNAPMPDTKVPVAPSLQAAPVQATTDAERLRAAARERREAAQAGALRFGDDPKSNSEIARLTQGTKRDPYAKN